MFLGFSYFRFYDLAVGSSTQVLLYSYDNSDVNQEKYDPTPDVFEVTYDKAIAIFPIPTLSYDKGQDMGMYSPTYRISGVCRNANKVKLENMAQLYPQFHSSYPNGRFQISYYDVTNTVNVSISSLVFRSLIVSEMAGTMSTHIYSGSDAGRGPWFRYTARLSKHS